MGLFFVWAPNVPLLTDGSTDYLTGERVGDFDKIESALSPGGPLLSPAAAKLPCLLRRLVCFLRRPPSSVDTFIPPLCFLPMLDWRLMDAREFYLLVALI